VNPASVVVIGGGGDVGCGYVGVRAVVRIKGVRHSPRLGRKFLCRKYRVLAWSPAVFSVAGTSDGCA
jgi:hypothetical protein